MSLARLSDQVRRDLTYLSFPSRQWTIPRYRNGARVLDVLIVGGGQGGLATAFGLRLEQINNIWIVDRNPRGLEGPWRRFARMKLLRTSKEVTGTDFGIPSLTPRAWHDAKFGRRAWERLEGFSPTVWRDYLDWYRDVLDLPVENEVEVTAIEPAGDLLVAHLRRKGRTERVYARKIVLATGFDGNGYWRIPHSLVADLPTELYAHSTEEIDFRGLSGKRIGVLGVGASAFDNAAAALEAGAARVDLCFRRAHVPQVNPLLWTHFAGMLGHFAELTDLERWRFMRHILEELPQPPPQDAYWRCAKFENFAWHSNCSWRAIRNKGGIAKVEAAAGDFEFEFIIFATGAETDLSARSELAQFVDKIALWRDRFTPPKGEESQILGSYPYLGSAFEFTEREPGTAPFLGRLHNFTFGATASVGLTGAAIPGIRYGVRRLVNALVRDLFREDSASYHKDLLAFAVPELETVESPYSWLANLGADALRLDDPDQATVVDKIVRGEIDLADRNDKSRLRPKRAGWRSRAKSITKKRPKRAN